MAGLQHLRTHSPRLSHGLPGPLFAGLHFLPHRIERREVRVLPIEAAALGQFDHAPAAALEFLDCAEERVGRVHAGHPRGVHRREEEISHLLDNLRARLPDPGRHGRCGRPGRVFGDRALEFRRLLAHLLHGPREIGPVESEPGHPLLHARGAAERIESPRDPVEGVVRRFAFRRL